MRGLLKTILLLVFFMASNPRAFGQFETQNKIKHYSIREGLSQAVVNSIVQDDQSFIWFATEDGLNRFDGYSFKVFKYTQELHNGFTDNFAQSLFRDSEGTLWSSSRKGLVRFNHELETFTLFAHKFREMAFSTPNDVSFITEGSTKKLWVAWYGNGFSSFDKSSGNFTVYNRSNLPSLSSDKTVSLLEDKHGLLWVGTQDGGLNVFNVSNGAIAGKITSLSNPPELSAPNVRCIVQDAKTNIWIGTSKGLVVYLREQNRFAAFNTFNNTVNDKSIFSLIADSNENLWIGTQGSGLYKLDLRQLNTHPVGKFVFTSIENLDDYDISKRTIQSFYEDANKNLWVGTFGNGVYMISSEKEKFIKIQKILYRGFNFTSVPFYGMCFDQKGYLWLGTDGNGLYRRSTYGKEEVHYVADGRKGSIGDNAILSALCDSKGRVWFGTYAHGVFQYDRNTDSFTHYAYKSNDPLRAGGNDVRVLYEDSQNNIWVGTNRGGLCLLDPKSKTYGNPANFSGVLKDGDVRAIVEDRKGNLWLGFYGDGLYRFNYESGEALPYFHGSRSKGVIQSRVVFALNHDVSDRLWIGTAGAGLYLYEPNSDSLRSFTEQQGLSNNTVYSILVDKANNCWISTNSGISKIEGRTASITNYQSIDGLQEGQFNPGSGLFNYIAGYMCFGGTLGVNVFYPEQIEEKWMAPKVVISGLQIFNRPVAVRDTIDGKPILKQVINKTKQISLNHDQSVITFEFIGLDYSYPEKNFYAYKLDGLDNEWNYVGHQRSATYRYLKPGTYEFRVKASNQKEVWGDEFASLVVVIDPPLSKTPVAYLIYTIIAVVLTVLFYRQGRKQLSLRKRLKIEKNQRKHERRMAMEKLTFFTEISHEFRTPLTLIMGPLEEMLSKEDAHSANARKLKMVYRNATKLLSLINKLLDYRKIESGNVILKVKEMDLVPFIEEIFESFRDLAQKKNINFTIHTEVPVLKVWFDQEKLEMVLNNILSNSFKYIGKGNEIGIFVSQQVSEKYPRGRAVIRIRDNGIGIPKKHIGNIFDWFYKGDNSGTMNSGIGLSLARKLAHLHKGDIYVESTEGKGTTFSVKIPLGKDHFKPEEINIVAEEPVEGAVAGPVAHPESEEEISARKGVTSVLIIEDDEEIRGFLREYFESTYKIHEASDGNEGLELANTLHPDLIISDIMMPGKDGIEVCKALKNNIRTSHIPVILLTARTSMVHHKEGIGIGADAYITKPFSPEILSLTISNLLQSRSQLMRFYRNLFMENSKSLPLKDPEASPDEKFLHTVYEQLKSNLDKPDFNVTELADVLNMSRSLVYKKIKMLTGLAPVEYIRSLRMQEAAKLLRSQKYKVFEVVYMVGFSDLKYFRQCFAREFGVSPSQFMKQAESTSKGSSSLL